MPAAFTADMFSTIDGFGSPGRDGNWGAYWDKQGPELLDHRLTQFDEAQRMVLGANTFRMMQMVLSSPETFGPLDEWAQRMTNLAATVVSSTLEGPLDWPGDATVASGDAVDVVTKLKETSDVPLRSHGSVSMNRALLAAGLVDRLQLTVFPVLSGQTGDAPLFAGAADFDLELLESRTLDGNILELVYRPTLHG